MKVFVTALYLISFCSYAAGIDGLVLPKDKKQIKKYYDAIELEAQKLSRNHDDVLLGKIISSCADAVKIDSNLFCLDSILEYYIKNEERVKSVASKSLNKESNEMIIKRLEIMKDEFVSGNDPSVN